MPTCGQLVLANCTAIFLGLGWIAVPSGSTAASPDPSTWPGADLFVTDQVQVIRIVLAETDLDSLRKEPRQFVKASVIESGRQYDEVAIHLKGSIGSFRPIGDKPGFTLDFSVYHAGQKFHGLRRIHLNNSVEDPAYCNEQLGSELFRSAGIPAPRVSRALLFLNDRRLGLYVLKEGATEDFLSCYFSRVGGNLYEPGEGHDVNQHLKRSSIPAPAQGRLLLKELAAAALDRDPAKSWQGLQKTLDLDRFIRFMCLEVMLCHRDGYSLARNNFRLYQDIDLGLMVFIPQGMDQLFGVTELPWEPHMAGLVARAVMQYPDGRQQYETQFKTLFSTLFRVQSLTNRVAQLTVPLKQVSTSAEFDAVQDAANLLQKKILQRGAFLGSQLNGPAPVPLEFSNDAAPLRRWDPADPPAQGRLDIVSGPGGHSSLHIETHSDAFASWRSKVWLEPGHYRFEAKVAISGVKPLVSGAHNGAGVRTAGNLRETPDLTGTRDWTVLRSDFQVQSSGLQEFVCELRASAGEAWFDLESLQVLRIR